MKKNLYKLFALLFAMGLFMVSCDDVSLDEPELDEIATQDNALALRSTGDIFGAVDGGISSVKSAEGCATILYVVETKTLTIDYGAEGCVGQDGITRKGLITTVFTGETPGWDVGETATTSFTDYYRDGKKLEGSIVIKCNAVQSPSFTVTASNMVLTFPDEQTVNWASEETITLEPGTVSNWRFNGGTTGTCTSRNGKTFSRTDNNLLSIPTCRWFIDGVLTMTIGDDVTIITFLETCGKIKVKHNDYPEFEISLD